MTRIRVLFLCTHNSARSQMAEGFLRALAGDRFEAASAGTEATRVHPLAVRAMGEVGIDLGGHASKTVDGLLGQRWDYVITVCDAANERCPVFPGRTRRLHWSFEDPSRVPGSEGERLEAFRRIRDEIVRTLRGWLATVGRVPILSIVGRTNSGKTTLIEKLLPALGRRGLRVATIKRHHHGDFEADHPGKDSWRHARAGAVATALAGQRRLAVFQPLDAEATPEEIARTFVGRPDLVLTEGYKEAPYPKVEVVRAAQDAAPLCRPEDRLIALVTDGPWDLGVPRFGLEATEALAAYVAASLLPAG